MKSLLYTLCTFLIYFYAPANYTAYCAEQTAEALVKEFYAWYIAEDAKDEGIPENNDAIYNYVYICTVNKLRMNYKKGIISFNYFYQSNDFDSKEDTIYVAPKSIKVSDTISIVPIGYTKEISMVVFVQHENGQFRIIKVEDFNQEY